MEENNPHYDLLVSQTKLKSCFNFKNDIKIGKIGEEFVDRVFNNDKTKIEVKKDDWAVKSRNLAIEFECRGKPSGIFVTQADFWVHIIGHYFLLVFPVDFLKKLCEELMNDSGYVKEMGDRGTNGQKVSKAILIPWHELLDRFKNYNICQ